MGEARITLLDFKGEQIGEEVVAAGQSFADTVMAKWPEGLNGVPIIENPEGHICAEEEALTRVIEVDEEWKIMLLPEGGALLVNIILAVVSVAAMLLLAPKIPNVQQNSYEWDDSDRPQFFSGQQNTVQPGRRVREAFGNIRVYPDIISAPAIRFQGTNQTIRELYVISNGAFAPDRTQFFDEDFADIPNSAVTYYYPGQAWPSWFPIMRYNQSVNNIELPAENEVISFGLTYQLRSNYIYVERDQYFDSFTASVGQQFRMSGVVSANAGPQRVTGVSANGRYLYVTPGFPTNQNIATGNVTFTGIEWAYSNNAGTPVSVYLDWVYWREVENQWPIQPVIWYRTRDALYYPVSGGGLSIVRTSDGKTYNNVGVGYINSKYLTKASLQPDEGTYWILRQSGGTVYNPDLPGTGYGSQAYNVPGNATEAWLDFEFPTGLYQQRAGEAPNGRQIQIEVYWRERIYNDDTTGWVRTVVSYSAKTRTPRRFTHTLTFPHAGSWEVYCARLTPFTPDTQDLVTSDAVMWTSLSGRQDTTELQSDILNVTLADVRLNNQGLRTTGSDRRFNVTGWRHLWDYRRNQWGATRRMSDAIMYTLVEQAGVPLESIDSASLWAIQDELDAQQESDGEFSAVIDQSMSAEDQVALIAGLSRTLVYRRAGTFYFARPKGGMQAATLINARNKIEPENRSFHFGQDNDPDAIIVRFQNRALNYNEDWYQYPEGVEPKNPEEQTVLGACNRVTIQKIAKYQYNKRKYEKDTVAVKMTEEGALLAPGDVVYITDHLLEELPIDGEIISVSGTTFTFDDVIPAGTYSGKVRDQFGELHAIATVTVPADSNVLTIPAWSGITMPSGQYGPTTGLLYSFEEIQYDNANRFLVRSVTPTRSGEVELEGILYREETFAGDAVNQVSDVESLKVISDFNPFLRGEQVESFEQGQESIGDSRDVTAEVEAMEAEQEGNQNG